jgi:hypothetical protein
MLVAVLIVKLDIELVDRTLYAVSVFVFRLVHTPESVLAAIVFHSLGNLTP